MFLLAGVRCRFFPPEATQEMLDEWRQLQCPFDMTMIDAFEQYSLFLPTTGSPDVITKAYSLWFPEFIDLYINLDGSGLGWEGVSHLSMTPQ